MRAAVIGKPRRLVQRLNVPTKTHRSEDLDKKRLAVHENVRKLNPPILKAGCRPLVAKGLAKRAFGREPPERPFPA